MPSAKSRKPIKPRVFLLTLRHLGRARREASSCELLPPPGRARREAFGLRRLYAGGAKTSSYGGSRIAFPNRLGPLADSFL